MTESKHACCSSPAAMCYWFVVSLIAWAVLNVIGVYWQSLHASSDSTVLFAMAIGCTANWVKNRSFHCGITAPLFFLAATVFLLSPRMTRFQASFVWACVVIGTTVAFFLEWRYTGRSAP